MTKPAGNGLEREEAARAAPSLDEIAGAERIMGIRYTGAERQQMQDNLDDQIDRAARRRALVFDNDAPMALRFDPRLPGFAMPGGADHQSWTEGAPPLPQAEEDIAFAPLPHLSHWLQSGQISSQRLCRIYLDRIARLAPDLFCFAHICAERSMAEAAAVDAQLAAGIRLGPLQGVPYGLKDLFDVAGLPTGWGAEPWRDRIAEADAAVVTRLRAAGAVLLGKTAVGALAYGDIWYKGRCRNPWNLNEGSSGSSAGSASAVAAGLCAFAIGTETLGSITSPSQRCGTTGLRPTFGRVSRAGGMVLCPTLDKVGPICRGVEDTAMVLAAINGGDPADPGSIAAPFRFEAGKGIAGLRVGYLAGSFGAGATDVDRAMLDALHDLGITPIPLDLPDLPYDALSDILMAEAAATFEAMTLSDQDDLLRWQEAAAWPNSFRKARFLSAVDHVQLDRLRYRVMQALDGLFDSVDLLIGPFNTGPMLVASNFTGHPCLHLRAGFLQRGTRQPVLKGVASGGQGPDEQPGPLFHVPQGISLWGRLFEEEHLLALGLALEAHLGVASARPGFAR